MRQQRALLSSKNDTAKAINYLFHRGATFTRFLDDGRVCLTNNAAERALRGVAVGRKNWTFAGSDTGGDRAASAYALIEICEMNDVDPQAWLADVLARLPDHPAKKIAETPQNTLPQTICAASGMSNFLFSPTFRIVAGCVSCPCERPSPIFSTRRRLFATFGSLSKCLLFHEGVLVFEGLSASMFGPCAFLTRLRSSVNFG
jgi:hypothetical protein